uniref:HECT domain-containing protein n=1 Tax=Amphora coffeiformis TaxID=265554 RepID=A0A7S3KWR1_9STRA|mmetsp:Transcript_21058/g.39989  ORF Transcript_21058/g.39989 Transcript_21058/m.39989 type:complete len:2766 (+) Transcript_21058:138-8435(+)
MEGESGDETADASGGAAAAPRRWTCDACGCHTNTETDTSCSICGTSQSGGSFLRRASHARAAWMARGLLGRTSGGRNNNNNDNPEDALLEEDAELWDTVVREVEIEREAIGRSMEGWPEGIGNSSSRQRFLEARARGSDTSAAVPPLTTMSPEELWNAALERDYSPNWTKATISGGGSSRQPALCMEIVSPQICTVAEGSGEGRAIRAEPALPRDASPTNRVVGFRVAFDHPTTTTGHSMGGCYLVGLTTSAFSAYSESNALAQSPFFWGIEDGGNKYEGPRHARRGPRRQSPTYSSELGSSVSRNAQGVLFGARDVVSVVCDMNTRTMCFWRNDTYLGPLVQGLPRNGALYPVVVPFNVRVSAAIGPLSQDLLPLLSQFSNEYRLQKELEEQAVRERLRSERQCLLRPDGELTDKLTNALCEIWKMYQDTEQDTTESLSFQAAARLWYRCGMSLASLHRIWKEKSGLQLKDLIEVLQKVLGEDEGASISANSSSVEKGDRVQLVEGYEKFGDAAGGPLRPGDRGTVVELQGSPNGESRSIRVIFNGRRWWYQPQALLSESSGLIETAGVWFVRRLLRAHAYHPTKLESLRGQSLQEVEPQAEDVVVPKTLPTSQPRAKNPMETIVGRVVVEQGSINKDEVMVESIHPAFTGTMDSTDDDSSSKVTLLTRTMQKRSLEYTTCFHGSGTDDSVDLEKMKVDGILPSSDESAESVSSKVQSDLTGVARLDGSAIESITKECKKNSEALANVFSAGLPEALLKATETAERQMRSLEPREDLPERISAVGSLTLYIAEQLFSDKPRGNDESENRGDGPNPDDDDTPPGLVRSRRGTSHNNSSRRSRAAVAAEAEQQGSTGLVASLEQRRGLLLSLMSRSRGGGGGPDSGSVAIEDALNPIADDLFFSRLPSSSGFYGPGDRAALLMASGRGDPPGRHLFEAASRSNRNNHRSTSDRNSIQEPRAMSELPSTVRPSPTETKSYLGSVLRSSSASSKSVGPSCTLFFQHMIRVGLISNSAAWTKACLDKHIKKSPQKTSSLLKQAYDEEGTPILKLAVTFGCSADVIGLLLACGAHVTSSDVRMAIETNQHEVLALFLRHTSLPTDLDVSKFSSEIKAVVEQARERQDRLDRKMRESAGEFMEDMLKRLIDLGLISRRHRTARLDSCSRSISEILVGNVLLRSLQQSQATEKNEEDDPDPSEESMTGRFSVEERLDSHPACGLFGSLPESILGDALFGGTELATNTLLLLEDFLCSKDMVDSSSGLTALFSLLVKFPPLRSCPELKRFGMLELVSFHDALASSRCAEALSSQVTSSFDTDGTGPARESGSGRSGNLLLDDSPGLVQCPKKHTAVLHITRHSSFRCDLCGNGVERGRIMHGCRECDWDACEECTDKAESGLVKCSAIREIANDCRKLLVTKPNEEMDENAGEPGAKYVAVINNIGTQSAGKDLEQLTVRLLRYDRKAIRDLALMLRSPGAITVHQFQNSILPALHVACVGRDDSKETGAGHKSKKARVAAQEFNEEGSRKVRNPEERTGFCIELVRAMILDVDESPRKREGIRMASSEPNSGNESEDGEEGSGESETEQRQVVNEREIAFFAEASELLRRLQQVLSLYENVNVSAVTGGKRSAAGGDLQSLTKPIELHLRPSTFGETGPLFSSRLVLNSEPLVAFSDIKRHILRCCGTMDPLYEAYCRRLVSDRAIIIERSEGSDKSWSIAEVVRFDESSGVHTLRYGRRFQLGVENQDFQLETPRDLSALVDFDSEETQIVLAIRQFFVVQRKEGGKKASLPESKPASGTTAPEVGTRVQNPLDVGSETKTCTVVACAKVDDKEVFTLVSDEGSVTNVQADALRVSERPSEAHTDDLSAARWMTRGGRPGSSSSETLNSVFPFLLSRRRGESEENEGSSDSALALKRSFSALSLADSLRPTDLVPSQMAAPSKPKDGELLFQCDLSGRRLTLRFSEGDIEHKPDMDVLFNVKEKLPGIEINHRDATLISAITKLYSQNGSPTDVSTSRPIVLYFSVTTEPRELSAVKQEAAGPKIAAEPIASLVSGQMDVETSISWSPGTSSRTRKLSARSVTSEDQDPTVVFEGLDAICMQSMEVISVLSEFTGETRILRDRERTGSVFANASLSKKLKDQLDDALSVVGGALPEWCITAPSFAPRVFSYDSRRSLLERAAFGVSRSTFKQQEAKVNVGRLRQRMASLRARAVELVGEAFSGGAEDPTALQLQADELYGMEEALATRVRAAFRAVKWKEHALEVAKAVIRRGNLLADADTIMAKYATDKKVNRRRLEVRFEGESGFDAASGDEAGVTRGFYADVAEALLSSDLVANVFCTNTCSPAPTVASVKAEAMELDEAQKEAAKLSLWIPDMDSSGQVVIPTPRADERSGLGVYPRPIPKYHPQMDEILDKFRFMGRLFAAAVRDGFMFPLPLSASFLKLVQHGEIDFMEEDDAWEDIMDMSDLPRPGFLGGEIYAAEIHVCRALDHLDASNPPLSRHELQRKYDEVARDQTFARVALGKAYECSFEDYFQDRTFVDPLDPAQDENAHPLCPKGHQTSVSVYNVRKWVALAKRFFLYDGVIAQAMAFRAGIEDFFSADYLRLFTAEELQRDVCGAGDNVETWDEAAVRKIFKLDGGKDAAEALVAVAAMGGEGGAALSRRFGPSSPTITNLVKVLLEASPQQRRQFLSFVTSVPIVTPGRIEVVPIVSPSGDFLPMRDPSCLPRANTCARRLYLPKFDDFETFKSILLSVVKEESKFKGFYEWRGS